MDFKKCPELIFLGLANFAKHFIMLTISVSYNLFDDNFVNYSK